MARQSSVSTAVHKIELGPALFQPPNSGFEGKLRKVPAKASLSINLLAVLVVKNGLGTVQQYKSFKYFCQAFPLLILMINIKQLL